MAQFQGVGAGRVQVEVLEPKGAPAQHRSSGKTRVRCKIAQTDQRSRERGLVVPQPVRVEKALDIRIVSRGGTLTGAAVSDKGRPKKVRKVGCEKPVVYKASSKVLICEMAGKDDEGAVSVAAELQTSARAERQSKGATWWGQGY